MVMRTRVTGHRFTAALGVTAFLAIGLLALPAQAEEPTVKIDNFTFNPPTLKVAAGAAVTWKNEEDMPHTGGSVTRTVKSQAFDIDDSYTFTRTATGHYVHYSSQY